MSGSFQQDELSQLRAMFVQQQAELAALHKKIGQLETAQVKAERPQAATSEVSRRRMLKRLGAAASGVAMLGVASTAGVQAATSDNLIIGQSNQPTNPADTTSLSNPSSTVLSPSLFRVDNGTGSPPLLSPPPDRPTAVVKAGVVGTITGANGGQTDTSIFKVGVFGVNDQFGAGVYGFSTNGDGVLGWSIGGQQYGVHGDSVNYIGGGFSGGIAPLFLDPSNSPNAPTVNTHRTGELYVDSNGAIFYCVAPGTPGTWRKLAGKIVVGPENYFSVGTLHLLPTIDRFGDSRAGTLRGTPTTGPYTTGNSAVFSLIGIAGEGGRTIPDKTVAVVGNITVLGNSGNGNVKVLPGDAATNLGTPTVYYNGGLKTANAFHCLLDATGHIKIVVSGGGSVDVLIDIAGYYL